MEHWENLGDDLVELEKFSKSAEAKYKSSQGPDKDPYCIAVVYTDHLAKKGSTKEIPAKNVELGSKDPVPVNIIDKRKDPHDLWNNIVKGEDWFVECYFIPDAVWGKIKHYTGFSRITIPKDKITLPNPSGSNESVSIDVSGFPKEKGKLYLVVNWVEKWLGGRSFVGKNIVTVCTRSKWQTLNSNKQNNVLIHEIGHQLGMVVSGTNSKHPDRVSTHYSGKGHKGDHCYANVGVKRKYTTKDALRAACVMFGANHSSRQERIGFCVNCAITVKKLDLSKGVKK